MYRETEIPAGTPGHKNNGDCVRKVGVGSEGDVDVWADGRWTNPYSSSINLADLCKKYGLDWSKESLEFSDDPYHPLRKFAEAEFALRMYLAFPDKADRAAINKVWELQKPVARRGRWRVYGGVEDGQPYAFLVQEAINWVDGEDTFWDDLIAVVEGNGGVVRTMDERPHLDRYYPARNVPGETLTDRAVSGAGDRYPADARFYAGPNDGRNERQVEMLWPIYDKTVAEVEALVAELEPPTETIWTSAGVNVI